MANVGQKSLKELTRYWGPKLRRVGDKLKWDNDGIRSFCNKFPSVVWTPNVAQERPTARWNGPLEKMPRVHAVAFGNRTGKTEWLAEFLTGVMKGNEWVNPDFFQCDFFDLLKEKRQSGRLTVWWVCDGEFMKANGPDYKIIKKHIPDAMFKAKMNNGVYREIHIPTTDAAGKAVIIVVSVKTHDMDPLSFAGDNVDVVLCDEPLPLDKWGELSGRMVNLSGEAGGRVVIGATPLKMAGYLLDMIEESEAQKDGRVAWDRGSIWENCEGSELPDEQANRLGIKKDPETGHYITRGHLSGEGIANAIENWQKTGDPDELKARVDGEFTHVAGRIYKTFSRDAHVVKDYTIPKSYPIIQVVDPHDARPDAAGWFMATPAERLVCIAEYPSRPFEMISNRSETVPMTCESWRKIEAELGIAGQIVMRIGDPNKMNDPDPYTGKVMHELYRQHGFRFNLDVSDNLEYGHERVRQFLYYDRDKWAAYPAEPIYQPHLLFFESCRNHINFMMKYTMKEWKDARKAPPTDIDQKFKDFPDLVRLLCVKYKSFSHLQNKMTAANSEWDAIKARRSGGSASSELTHSVFTGPRQVAFK